MRSFAVALAVALAAAIEVSCERHLLGVQVGTTFTGGGGAPITTTSPSLVRGSDCVNEGVPESKAWYKSGKWNWVSGHVNLLLDSPYNGNSGAIINARQGTRVGRLLTGNNFEFSLDCFVKSSGQCSYPTLQQQTYVVCKDSWEQL